MIKLPKNLKENDVVEILWDDAFGSSGWRDAKQVCEQGAYGCRSIGYYVGQSKAKDVLLATTLDNGGAIAGVTGHPIAMIRSIKKIK